VVLKYTTISTERLWKMTNAWSDQTQTFDDFKAEIFKLYPVVLGDRTHTIQEMNWVVGRYACIRVLNVDILGKYYCQFLLITCYLIGKGSISTQEQLESRTFFRGLQPNLEACIQEHLQQKFVVHFPDNPYQLADIYEATSFVLMGTTAAVPLEQAQPSLLSNPSVVASPPNPTSANLDTLTAAITSLASMCPTAIQTHYTPAATTRTSTPGNRVCAFCGNTGHYIRECEGVEEVIC
jgi:hypothetical protein